MSLIYLYLIIAVIIGINILCGSRLVGSKADHRYMWLDISDRTEGKRTEKIWIVAFIVIVGSILWPMVLCMRISDLIELEKRYE